MGEGVAQLISLGLAQHPVFVPVARAAPVDAVLHERLDRQDGQLVLQPTLVDVQPGPTRWLLPITMADADFMTQVASLPASYARALQVTLTEGETARMGKAARPTRSLSALEQFTAGRMAFADGANDRAIALILRAIELDPDFVIAQYTLGSVHQALKNRWKAAAQFRSCTPLDPSMPEPYKAIGDLLLEAPRGLFDLAIEAYSKAITLRPFYADAHVGLGDARRAKGDLDGALAAYRAAATFDPFNPLTYLKLGTVYRQRALCAAAVGAVHAGTRARPELTHAQKSLAAISGTSCH